MGCGIVRRLARVHVHNAAAKMIAVAIVPHDIALRLRHPLQHATLLPAPGIRTSELDPAIAILQVDHANVNPVVRRRRPMLEVNFHSQHITVRRVEFKLVVVAEPVKLWTLRKRSYGR